MAGCARFTRACVERKVNAMGIDWLRNKSKPEAAVCLLDLCDNECQLMVLRLIQSGRTVHVHMAPPCGTASRARERRISKKLRQQGCPEPLPLRSNRWPEGLPNLKDSDKERVQSANVLYAFCEKVCIAALDHNVRWSIENPLNSIFWLTQWMQRVSSLPGVIITTFSNCSHGGDRPKMSKLLHNAPLLHKVQAVCPGVSDTHSHLPWGAKKRTSGWEFATADEAAYPHVLAARLAEGVIEQAKLDGKLVSSVECDSASKSFLPILTKTAISPPPEQTSLLQAADPETKPATRVSSGKQLRGKFNPVLIPERQVQPVSNHHYR
jgi:hypothetical protein